MTIKLRNGKLTCLSQGNSIIAESGSFKAGGSRKYHVTIHDEYVSKYAAQNKDIELTGSIFFDKEKDAISELKKIDLFFNNI